MNDGAKNACGGKPGNAWKGWTVWACAILIVVATTAAYWNGLDAAFVYDDILAIRDNVHIRQLWPLSEAFSLAHWTTGSTVDGRPLLSLSFALNYAFLGDGPSGYHFVNLLIHLAAALLLFGIVRRTATACCQDRADAFGECPRPDRHGDSPGARRLSRSSRAKPRDLNPGSTLLALAAALLWAVHPIQTESVTYIAQRAESLMGMLFLLTMYCSIRGFEKSGLGSRKSECGISSSASLSRSSSADNDSARAVPWYLGAVLACAAGMAVKEVMVAAPIAVLLYDYTFVSGASWRVLRHRMVFYAGLFGCWLITVGLLFGIRADIAENYEMTPWLPYLITQPRAILHYLRLSVWPHPLIMDYNWPLADGGASTIVRTGVVGVLVLLSVWGLWRRHWAGFAGAFFFLVLAPTSSFFPCSLLVHEHRMYLPLASVVVLAVAGIAGVVSRVPRVSGDRPPGRAAIGSLVPILTLALLFGVMTSWRNRDYRTDRALWSSNVAHHPESYVAHHNLGRALDSSGRTAEAIEHYKIALQLNPELAEAHYNWGAALSAAGRRTEAIEHYRQALRIEPERADAHNNLANDLMAMGRVREAIPHFRGALRINPGMASAHYNLGNALQATGELADAILHYRHAVRLEPGYAEAYNNLGNALLAIGRPEEAIASYREALTVRPQHAEAHYNMGVAMEALGRSRDALHQYEEAVRLNPRMAAFRHKLGILYQQHGRLDEAISQFEQTVRIDPDFPGARVHLQKTRARLQAQSRPPAR